MAQYPWPIFTPPPLIHPSQPSASPLHLTPQGGLQQPPQNPFGYQPPPQTFPTIPPYLAPPPLYQPQSFLIPPPQYVPQPLSSPYVLTTPPLQPLVPPTHYTSFIQPPTPPTSTTTTAATTTPATPLTANYSSSSDDEESSSSVELDSEDENEGYVATPLTPIKKRKEKKESKRHVHTTECKWLNLKGWCFRSSCDFTHPCSKTICRNAISGGGCSSNKCVYQHPHDAYIAERRNTLTNGTGKVGIFSCDIVMNTSVCPTGPTCTVSRCPNQHKIPKTIKGATVSNSTKYLKVRPLKLTDVTNDLAHMTLVKKTITASASRPFTIVKLEAIESTQLTKKFNDKKNQLPSNDRATLPVFHGTPDQNIQPILQTGFDLKYISRTAHGYGLYFARDPQVSVGYCGGGKRMFYCELLLSATTTTWHPQVQYYVAKDDAAIRPLYLITFA